MRLFSQCVVLTYHRRERERLKADEHGSIDDRNRTGKEDTTKGEGTKIHGGESGISESCVVDERVR